MNFFKSTFIFIVFFSFTFLNAQELPPINNYSPKLYGAENQNWAISQSIDKYIYVANNSGLLEFNGAKWKVYPSPNNSIMRSVNVIGDKIYTGCYREFGYWKKDDFGNLEYYSLSDKINESISEDEEFWNIVQLDDWVLFQSLHRIFIYNTNSKSFNIINSETQLPKVFKVDGSIYFQKMGDGLYKIENGKAVLLSNNPVLKSNILVNIFLVNKKILVQTQESGFFFMDGNDITKWSISANKILSSISVYSSSKLSDGSFVIGSIADGIYQINEDGVIFNHINQENGLNNNTVLSMYEDYDENLWLGLDNGISVINFKSPFNVFNDVNGKIGAVYASIIFNNKLYLGTNQGLFYKKVGSLNSPKFIEGTKGQVWCLKEFENTLFCGHNRGTFVVNNNSAELIADVMGTWDIKSIDNKKNILIQGHYKGLNILEKVNNKWQYRNELNGFNISSRQFEFSGDKQLFVNHEHRGVFRLKLNDDYTEVVKFGTVNSTPKGLKSSFVSYNSNLFYVSDKGIFKYENEHDKFFKDSILSNKFLKGDDYVSGKLIVDNKINTVWGFTRNNIIYFSPGKLNDVLKENIIPLPNLSRRDIPGYESMTHLHNQTYLFGTSNGYIVLDLDKMKKQEFNIHINSVEKSKLNNEKEGVALINQHEFNSSENNVYFSFSVPSFDEYNEVKYSYQLNGMHDEWSDWSLKSEESFENLPFGEYVFNVRSKIGNHFSENVASFSFTINRPWYLSNLMLIIYFLFFIGIVIIVHTFYKRYYTNQKQKLLDKKQREFTLAQYENDQVLMQIKNKQLSQEIESKNRELTISTMSIIKKNEILNKIKKELLLVENAGVINKQVIKTIDKNINSKKDWEFLEDAFNNADKDFLKRVKNLHSELTPNDLRFCAYLRLNLSSKEIAPLLNISVRSVEIKRYRLRKKMNLAHENSLVDYILSI